MKSSDIVKVENLNRGKDFIIRWSVTYLCNYACDFCIQGNKKNHIDKSKDESIKIRTKICDNLINFIENKLDGKYDFINFYLLGGEVTILKDFFDIIEKIVNCKFKGKISIRLTTNLSMSKEKVNRLVDIFNKKYPYIRELCVSASYYKEFANIDEFTEKIMILNKNNKISKLSFLKNTYKLLKKSIKRIKGIPTSNTIHKIKNKIEKINVTIGYPISNDSDYIDYLKFKKKYQKFIPNIHFIVIKGYKTIISDKLKKKILKEEKQEKNIKVTFDNGEVFYCSNNNKISLKLDEENFKSHNYLCDIGMNNISISNIGNVSRCSSCKEKTIIGNMLDNNFELPKDKIKCPAYRCNCTYYKVIEK